MPKMLATQRWHSERYPYRNSTLAKDSPDSPEFRPQYQRARVYGGNNAIHEQVPVCRLESIGRRSHYDEYDDSDGDEKQEIEVMFLTPEDLFSADEGDMYSTGALYAVQDHTTSPNRREEWQEETEAYSAAIDADMRGGGQQQNASPNSPIDDWEHVGHCDAFDEPHVQENYASAPPSNASLAGHAAAAKDRILRYMEQHKPNTEDREQMARAVVEMFEGGYNTAKKTLHFAQLCSRFGFCVARDIMIEIACAVFEALSERG